MRREYADAGVDYGKIDPFKAAMVAMSRRTLQFPRSRGVSVREDGSFVYVGRDQPRWRQVTEGLGNKNWIAEWMYRLTGDVRYFDCVGRDTLRMAEVDVLRHGALPVVYTDEVAARTSEWFADEKRTAAIAASFYEGAYEAHTAIVGGESPALRYLVRPEPPVADAPVFSGSITGIHLPGHRPIKGDIPVGADIVGAVSSGIHANGISLVIKRALGLPEQFLTKLPNTYTLGWEALRPTVCYVSLVERLLNGNISVYAIVPATGDGVAKLLRYRHPRTYRIASWPEVPPLFQFMREIGVPIEECLRTFNWGIGLYLFTAPRSTARLIAEGERAGCKLVHLGRVDEGERRVIFGPEQDLVLRPE